MQCCKSISLAASLIPAIHANTSRSNAEIKSVAAVEVLQAHYSHCLIQALLSLYSLSWLLKSRMQNLKREKKWKWGLEKKKREREKAREYKGRENNRIVGVNIYPHKQFREFHQNCDTHTKKDTEKWLCTHTHTHSVTSWPGDEKLLAGSPSTHRLYHPY